MKRAFTLLEVVFTLVVLGIVASITSEIIAKVYEQNLLSLASSKALSKTELALETIAKRLGYRVMDSGIAILDKNHPDNMVPLTSEVEGYEILEWIGYSYESFLGEFNGSYNAPGWSGLIDLDNSDTNASQFITPGSTLAYAKDIIQALFNKDLDDASSNIAIIFRGGVHTTDAVNAYYKAPYPEVFGIYRINDENDTLHFTDTGPKTLYEQYYLVASAYAIVPEKSGDEYNLTLYYNFQPWENEKFIDGNTTVLVTGVTKFKFRKVDKVIEIALCTREHISQDINITYCGKKVIY